jgi:adenylate kinase family enzyme
MCGVAGSGKTTFSQQLEKEGFVRLSIDEEIWITNGHYGIDIPAELATRQHLFWFIKVTGSFFQYHVYV